MPTTIPGTLILQSPAANDPLLDLNTQPSLDLQFATSKTLDDRVSGLPLVDHQRDASGGKSAGTYVGSDGLIKTTPVNLLLYSEEFDNAVWTKARTSIIPNSTAAPDGTQTADKMVEDSTSGPKGVYQSANSGQQTFSVYAKQSERSIINIFIPLSTGAIYTYFDISTGSIGTIGLNSTASIQDAGGGWYRCSVSGSFVSGVTGVGLSTIDNQASYQGDGTSGVYIWGAQLEEGTTATDYIPTTNLPSGAPRFDHDPATGESLGLLIEESRTNLMVNSGTTAEMVATQQATRTSGGFAAPDGSTDASRVDLPAVAGGNQTQIITEQFGGLSTNTDYTASVYLKGLNGGEVVYLTFEQGTPTSFVTATLTTEWQRFDITGSTSSGPLYFNVGVDTRTGTGQSNQPAQSFYVWGAQVELGSFPTSYIPTEGSTVTRAADVAEITGANFANWFNTSEQQGTVFTEVATKGTSGVDAAFAIGSNNDVDRWLQQYFTPNTLFYEYEQGLPPAHTYTTGTFIKSAIGRSQGDNAVGLSGSIVQTDSYSGSYSPVFMKIGVSGDANRIFNGHIKRLTYYPYRLGDTTLQEITS